MIQSRLDWVLRRYGATIAVVTCIVLVGCQASDKDPYGDLSRSRLLDLATIVLELKSRDTDFQSVGSIDALLDRAVDVGALSSGERKTANLEMDAWGQELDWQFEIGSGRSELIRIASPPDSQAPNGITRERPVLTIEFVDGAKPILTLDGARIDVSKLEWKLSSRQEGG